MNERFLPKPFFFIIILTTLFAHFGNQNLASAATTNLSADVSEGISLSLSGSDYEFGYVTPGFPEKGTSGIVATVITSSANGYDLGIADETAGTDSSMLNEDGLTRIIDFASLINAPEIWDSGVSKGLGFTVFSADTDKEVKWGTGTTYDDVFNQYAGIPQFSDTIHQSPDYKEGEDHTGLSFILDVTNDQKSGVYYGNVVMTATARL